MCEGCDALICVWLRLSVVCVFVYVIEVIARSYVRLIASVLTSSTGLVDGVNKGDAVAIRQMRIIAAKPLTALGRWRSS